MRGQGGLDMKKIMPVFLLLLFSTGPVFAQQSEIRCEDTKYLTTEPVKEEAIRVEKVNGLSVGDATEFIIYSDKGKKENHFAPSGWMGDYADIKMDDGFMDSPQAGSSCVQFTYNSKLSSGKGWAGVYWQNPANNWGTKNGGFDLSKMTKLTFWAKGAKGGEIIQKFVVGGIKGMYPDSVVVELGPVELTNTWKQYAINLVGKDLSYVSGGFGWTTTAELNPNGCTFYLDDIKFVADSTMKPQGRLSQDMPFYIYSDRGSVKNHYIPSGWMGDYGDIKYDGASQDSPYFGTTCIKIAYCACAYQGARWAGIYWQNPANNWGSIDGGFDISKATKLTFWARGAKGGERVEEFKVGGINGDFGDSDSQSVGPIELTTDWKQYTIDLTGKNLSNIIGGFCWTANIDGNPTGFVIYLDEIKFE